MKIITSRLNPLIKHLALLQDKKNRTAYGQFCAEGARACTTLINSGLQPLALVVTDAMLSTAQKIGNSEYIYVVPPHVMEKISTSETPSGLLCQFSIPQSPSPCALTSGIVLARITDPGNMGTLIRTAAGLNIKSVVVIEGTDPWSPKVVQSSAGTIGMVSLFAWNWETLMMHKKNYTLCALVIAGGKNPSQVPLHNALFVVGSEAEGIPPAWTEQCDETITLPMPGSTESLNAAVAGSIMLYLASQSR